VAEGAEYPKCLYRLGSQTEVWGRMMDLRTALDGEDEAAALETGWSLHPLDCTDEPDSDAPKRRGRPPKLRTDDGDA